MQGVRLPCLPCIQELHYDRGVPFSFTEKFPFDLALSESLRTLCLRFNFNELDFGWNTNFIGHWTDPVRCRPAMLKKLVVKSADFTIVSDGMNSLRHVVNLEELRVSSLMSISSISNPCVSLLSPYTHLTRYAQHPSSSLALCTEVGELDIDKCLAEISTFANLMRSFLGKWN